MKAASSGVETTTIALSDLVARKDRATRWSKHLHAAVATALAEGRPYASLIVRRHPTREGRYEIVDGHCRAESLGRLGQTHARCEVWALDDRQAAVAAWSLNQIRGRPDARRRAKRVRSIARHLPLAAATQALGLSPAAIRQQTASLRRPRVSDLPPMDLQPVVFHVSSGDAEFLEQAIAEIGNGANRGAALVEAVRRMRQNLVMGSRYARNGD